MNKKTARKCQICRKSQSANKKPLDIKIYYIVEGAISSAKYMCTPCFLEFNKKQFQAHQAIEPDYDRQG